MTSLNTVFAAGSLIRLVCALRIDTTRPDSETVTCDGNFQWLDRGHRIHQQLSAQDDTNLDNISAKKSVSVTMPTPTPRYPTSYFSAALVALVVVALVPPL